MRSLRFYFLVAVCGAVLMALEILASRLLSPHFGSSVYVWGSIISVFLAALSLGYTFGGRLADRFPSLVSLGQVVVLSGLCQSVLLLAGEPLTAALGRMTHGSPAGTLLATAVLFGPATVLLGMVSPWAVRLAARDLGELGHLTGRLYAVSTAGSLCGTLLCTFVLIPFLNLGQILALLLLLTAAAGALALADSVRQAPWQVVLATMLVILGLTRLALPERLRNELYRRITPYQTLQVFESDGVRSLQSDRVVQAAIHVADGRSAVPYNLITPAALLLQPRIHNVLMLGLGGGNCAKVLRQARPDVHVEYVEIDPVVPEVAGRFLQFALVQGDRLHIDDARRFLEADTRQWDLVYVDTYIGRAVPFHLATQEFFTLVRSRLAPGGVIGVNLASGAGHPFPKALLRTLSDSFPRLYPFLVPQRSNVVVFGTTAETPRVTANELAARARELDRDLHLEIPLAKIVGLGGDLDADLLDAPLLTDAFAPVERLVSLSPNEALATSEPAGSPAKPTP